MDALKYTNILQRFFLLHNLRLAVIFEDERLEAQQFLSVCKEQPLAPRERSFVGENEKADCNNMGLCFFYSCVYMLGSK